MSSRHTAGIGDVKWIALFATLASIAAFGCALRMPIFTVIPAAGQWTPVVRLLAPDYLLPQTFTLPSATVSLWTSGERLLAAVLAGFALVLPTLKLLLLWWEVAGVVRMNQTWTRFLQMISRYAMVEVFLVALTVILVKEMPGNSHVVLQPGFYAFTGSILLSLGASQMQRAGRKS